MLPIFFESFHFDTDFYIHWIQYNILLHHLFLSRAHDLFYRDWLYRRFLWCGLGLRDRKLRVSGRTVLVWGWIQLQSTTLVMWSKYVTRTRGWEDDLRITLYRSKMQLSNQSLYRSKKQFKNLFSISQECDSRIHTFYKTRAWFSKPLTVTVVYQYEHWFGGITLLQLSSKSIEMFIKKYTCNNKFNDRTIGFENIFLDFIKWKNNQHCFSMILSNSSINKK